MTAQQLKNLEAIILNSDFIPTLRTQRPGLGELTYQQAHGWEQCIDYIVAMVLPPERTALGGQGFLDPTGLDAPPQ